MPKAGRYDYPEAALDECIERLRKVHEVAKTDVVKREVVADILGMKPKTGWFNTLIGSMSQYGLVEARGGEVRITELAKTILYGEPSEVAKAKAQAVRNIKLFNDLFNQYGLDLTEDQLKVFLRQKAYVDVSEVQSLTEKIGKLFKKAAQYLSPAEGVGLKPIEARPTVGGGEMAIEKEGVWELRTDEYGVLRIVDTLSAEYAIKIIEKLKERFQTKESQKEGQGASK